jgi:2-polyprenyl-6-methoxyphenol hydroxylase-like FAD-dependent oxidoreductase
VAASATPRSEENIVIVGAGVAGLATAVALRRR